MSTLQERAEQRHRTFCLDLTILSHTRRYLLGREEYDNLKPTSPHNLRLRKQEFWNENKTCNISFVSILEESSVYEFVFLYTCQMIKCLQETRLSFC